MRAHPTDSEESQALSRQVMPFDVVSKKLGDLRPFIAYLKATTPEEWQVDKVRNAGNTQNCVMGHLVNWVYGKDYEGSISAAWDIFEEVYATTYMIYPVNDGKTPDWMNHRYEQPTARERVIAYLSNLVEGKEKTTQDLWNEEYENHVAVTTAASEHPDDTTGAGKNALNRETEDSNVKPQ